MIQSIHLRNFESHKNTKLEFGPGINIISGQSNHGKSSIIRGIYWIKDNKPSGTPMVSFWNRDSKNNPRKNTYVELVLGNGNTISRERSPDLNGYRIGDKKLEAVGQSVPDEIGKVLKISDVNIQYQFDRPFLLDDSSAEVARFFNKTIRLDLIDRIQAKAEKMRKDLNKDVETNEIFIKSKNIEIYKYNWIEDAEKVLVKLEEIQKVIATEEGEANKIQALIDSYREYYDTAFKAKKIASLSSLVDKIEAVKKVREENEKEIEEIEYLIDTYESLKTAIAKAKKISGLSELVEKIEKIREIIRVREEEISTLESLISEYETAEITMKLARKEIKELEATLPKICPTCGARL